MHLILFHPSASPLSNTLSSSLSSLPSSLPSPLLSHPFVPLAFPSFVPIISITTIVSISKCQYIGSWLYCYYNHGHIVSLLVSLYQSLCFLSYPTRVLACFYSAHSPAIFITQRTNSKTSLCLSFSLSPFLALSVSPLSNSLSKWDCR